jgi:FtsH-binding integral membrane protein
MAHFGPKGSAGAADHLSHVFRKLNRCTSCRLVRESPYYQAGMLESRQRSLGWPGIKARATGHPTGQKRTIMSEYRNTPLRSVSSTQTGVDIDEGLRSYMLKVYNLMAMGLAITGIAAYGLSTYAAANPAFAQLIYASPLRWVIVLAPLAMVFFLAFRVQHMSVSAAQTTFWVYAGLVGASLSTIFLVYTGASIVKTFFVTATAFGALSLFGYTTKRDLTGMGSFLIMGLFGIIIAMIVNIWLASPAIDFVVSILGVLIFAGLTAYDTQKIKEMYYEGDDATAGGRKAVMGALTLYLDFVNMFMFLLNFLGNRE